MKTASKILFLVLASFLTVVSGYSQGTAFSYQGHLSQGGDAANGNYDFVFGLFDDGVNGKQVGDALSLNSLPVSNGQFNATLDFGAGPFTGQALWLQVSVRQAGNGEPVLLQPRSPILPMPYSVFAARAGSVDKGAIDPTQLSASHPPALGRVLSYDGAAFDWIDPVAQGIWTINGNNTFYNALGGVAIGTNSPSPGVKLEVNGATRITPGGSGGIVQIGTPNGETGLGVVGVNRFDLRFDGATLKLGAGPGSGPPPSEYGITINTNGNVGMGMRSPLIASQWKLEIAGPVRMNPGGSGGAIQFSTPNGETGMGFVGTNRADIRFDGLTLKLLAGPGTGPPPLEYGLAVTTSGNVGVGTTTPKAKLHVVAAPQSAIMPFFTLPTGLFSNVGIFSSAPAGNGIGVWAQAQAPTGVALYADGNAIQPAGKSGLPKAMVHVAANGVIDRCYNGITGDSGAACKFTVTEIETGLYKVDLGFKADDRFAVVTAGFIELGNSTTFGPPGSAAIVYGYQPSQIGQSAPTAIFVSCSWVLVGTSIYRAGFTLIVY